MKFAEFFPGQVLRAGPRLVTEEEILAFATAYDPQWFHVDKAAAEAGRFGTLIASGWHTCGIAMRMAVDTALAGSESFASPGLAHLKWRHPVRPGDRLSLTATVLETRRAESRPTMGILRWRWQLHNAHGTEVLDLEATSLFDLPPPADGATGSATSTDAHAATAASTTSAGPALSVPSAPSPAR